MLLYSLRKFCRKSSLFSEGSARVCGSRVVAEDRCDVVLARHLRQVELVDSYTWKLSESIALIPEGRLFWQHEFLENPRNISSSLDGGGGPSFDYTTSSPDRDAVFSAARLSAKSDRTGTPTSTTTPTSAARTTSATRSAPA